MASKLVQSKEGAKAKEGVTQTQSKEGKEAKVKSEKKDYALVIVLSDFGADTTIYRVPVSSLVAKDPAAIRAELNLVSDNLLGISGCEKLERCHAVDDRCDYRFVVTLDDDSVEH